MRSLKLALRALRREWRSGELAVLWLSLSIAVAALSGVGFLVDRIGRAVELQASEVLAADLRVESDAPIVADEQSRAQQLGLTTAQMCIRDSRITARVVAYATDERLGFIRLVLVRFLHGRSP